MTQDAPRPIHVKKVNAISEGTAQPLLMPRANLPGIYKNIRAPGATTEDKLYDLLFRRMEEGKPVDWNSVSEEVTGELKAHQDWYKAVLIRMFQKEWIDVPEPKTPEPSLSNAPVQQQGAKVINALAEDIYNGISEAGISDEKRNSWRVNLLSVPDPNLQAACVWYMEQIEQDLPHSPDDWVTFVAAQEELSPSEAGKAEQLLLEAIDYLQANAFIVEVDSTALYDENIDFDAMADEIGMMIDIGDGKKRLTVVNAELLAEKIEQYARESDPGKKDTRAIQHELLRRVRDNESTAWADVYAAVKDQLSDAMNKGKSQQVYLSAVDLSIQRGIIRVADQE